MYQGIRKAAVPLALGAEVRTCRLSSCVRLQEIFADEHAEGRVWDRCIVVAYFPPEVGVRCMLPSRFRMAVARLVPSAVALARHSMEAA